MENSKQCGYCGKTFGTTYLLQTHMQVHSETKILLKSAKLDKKGWSQFNIIVNFILKII
jgi:hypothetical protein